MKTRAPFALVAVLALVLPSMPVTSQTTLVGPGVNNGDFNDDTSATDKRNFDESPSWQNLSGAQTAEATRLDLDFDGTRNAVISQGGATHACATGYTIAPGDVFDLNYWWRDAWNWDNPDVVRFTLFTTPDDDLTNPARTVLINADSAVRTTNASWEEVNQPAIHTATGADAGRTLFVLFDASDNGGGNGYGWFAAD